MKKIFKRIKENAIVRVCWVFAMEICLIFATLMYFWKGAVDLLVITLVLTVLRNSIFSIHKEMDRRDDEIKLLKIMETLDTIIAYYEGEENNEENERHENDVPFPN